jgi:multidrug efflux pump subunit AcrA (membrane-fusion protein)
MREQILGWLRQAAAQFRQRSTREQLLIAGAGLSLLLVFLQVALVSPLQTQLEKTRAETTSAERDLGQVVVLAPELQRVRARLSDVQQRIQPGDQTNLLQLLGQLAQDADVKVESIRQKVGARNDQFPETRAEVELLGATLAQTVQYLYKIESAPLYLIVRSLAIKARGDDSQLLDVTFSVSSFQRA